MEMEGSRKVQSEVSSEIVLVVTRCLHIDFH